MLLKEDEWLDRWQHEFEQGYTVGYQGELDSTRANLHFLHGNGFAVCTYRRFLSYFEDGYNLTLQEAAGHGLSPAGKQFVGWNGTAERFAQSVTARLPQWPKTERIGMGHSFGGCMTALMSARHPELFDRLVLLDPAMFPPRLLWLMRGAKLAGLRSQTPLAKQAKRRRTQWESFAQVKANFEGRGTFKGWQNECLEDYIRYAIRHDETTGLYHLACPPWMEAAIFASYPKGLWQAVRTIKVPTVIVQGEDTYSYFQEAYRLAAHINPNISVVSAQGAHCFMQEHPEQTARLVRDILQQKKSAQ